MPEVWGSKYDVRELLRACYYAVDKKPISELPLSFGEREAVKILLKKVKGTDVELLLRESGLLELILSPSPAEKYQPVPVVLPSVRAFSFAKEEYAKPSLTLLPSWA